MPRKSAGWCRKWRVLVVAGLAAVGLQGIARAETRVVVVGLVFEGEVPDGVKAGMAQELVQGLRATGLQMVPEAEVQRALGDHRGQCSDVACWKRVAASLGCRYAVGGSVTGQDQDYAIALWMGDAYTGTTSAWARERCTICGLAAAREKMSLTASLLAAKLTAAARAPARVTVVSDPPGASVLVDGDEVGAAPRELELGAGDHEIVVRSPGFLAATRKLTAVAGVNERIDLRLVPLAGASSGTRILAWTSIAAGAAALATGIALLAIDGQEVDCAVGAPDFCQRRETTAAGATLVGVGAVAAGVGGYLLYRTRASAGRSAERATRLARNVRLSFDF
jgi:hypothetical protein